MDDIEWVSRILKDVKICYAILSEQKEVVVVDDLLRWANFMEDGDRLVSRTNLFDGIYVSTVFLGLSQSESRPKWFETMVFGCDEEAIVRHGSYIEAVYGHIEIVKELVQIGSKKG